MKDRITYIWRRKAEETPEHSWVLNPLPVTPPFRAKVHFHDDK